MKPDNRTNFLVSDGFLRDDDGNVWEFLIHLGDMFLGDDSERRLGKELETNAVPGYLFFYEQCDGELDQFSYQLLEVLAVRRKENKITDLRIQMHYMFTA